MDNTKGSHKHSQYIHTEDCPITKIYGTNHVKENFYVTKEITCSNSYLNKNFNKIVDISTVVQYYSYELRRKMDNQLYEKILCFDKESIDFISRKFTDFIEEYSLTNLLAETIRGSHEKRCLCLNFALNLPEDSNNPIAPIPTWISNSAFIKKIQEPIYRDTKNQLLFWALCSLLFNPAKTNKIFYTLLEIKKNKNSKHLWDLSGDKGDETCVMEGRRLVWDYLNDYVYVTDNYKHWAILNTKKGSPVGLYEPHCYWYE